MNILFAVLNSSLICNAKQFVCEIQIYTQFGLTQSVNYKQTPDLSEYHITHNACLPDSTERLVEYREETNLHWNNVRRCISRLLVWVKVI